MLPGTYEVRLTVGDRVHIRSLEVRMDPALTVSQEDRRALDATLELQARLVGAAAVSGAVVDTLLAQVGTVLESLTVRSGAPATLSQRARALEAGARRLRVALEGPGELGVAQQETTLPLATLVGRLYSTTEAWTGAPTADQARLTALAHRQLAHLLADLRPLLEQGLPGLRQAMDQAGIPWPAGEAPELPDNLLPPYRP